MAVVSPLEKKRTTDHVFNLNVGYALIVKLETFPQFSAIALDSYGWPHISYQCYEGDLATGQYVLKYARYDGHLPTPPAVGGEAYPINKVAVLALWLALAAAIIVGACIVLRRRSAHSQNQG